MTKRLWIIIAIGVVAIIATYFLTQPKDVVDPTEAQLEQKVKEMQEKNKKLLEQNKDGKSADGDAAGTGAESGGTGTEESGSADTDSPSSSIGPGRVGTTGSALQVPSSKKS